MWELDGTDLRSCLVVELELAEFSFRVPPTQTPSIGLLIGQMFVATAAEVKHGLSLRYQVCDVQFSIFRLMKRETIINRILKKLTLCIYRCELTLCVYRCELTLIPNPFSISFHTKWKTMRNAVAIVRGTSDVSICCGVKPWLPYVGPASDNITFHY